MKYIFLAFLIYACGSPKKSKPVAEKPPAISYVDSLISSLQKSQDRFCFTLSIISKRDSFIVKKYENEVLYYQTGDDKYRKRGNRFVDSTNKYVHIIDSIAKQLK